MAHVWNIAELCQRYGRIINTLQKGSNCPADLHGVGMVGDRKIQRLNNAPHTIRKASVLAKCHAKMRRDSYVRGFEQRANILKAERRLAFYADFERFDVTTQRLRPVRVRLH